MGWVQVSSNVTNTIGINIVGKDVTAFILNRLSTQSFRIELNDAFITPIPKKSQPKSPADLRPIALCNIVYKVMAKMIANRMKNILGEIVSENQSAFIPRRLITDHILLAAEAGHYLKSKT